MSEGCQWAPVWGQCPCINFLSCKLQAAFKMLPATTFDEPTAALPCLPSTEFPSSGSLTAMGGGRWRSWWPSSCTAVSWRLDWRQRCAVMALAGSLAAAAAICAAFPFWWMDLRCGSLQA